MIVKVLGKRVSFKQLEAKLNREWTKNGPISVTDLAEGYYLVRLSSQGPWKVADHYLIVQRWHPLFTLSATMTHKIAVWVRIPRLPIELCNDVFLKRIGACIGYAKGR